MTLRKVVCGISVLLLMACLTVWAQQQQPASPAPPEKKEKPTISPNQPMEQAPEGRQQMMEKRRQMMEAMRDPAKMREMMVESGVPADMIDQCKAVMDRPVYLDDPMGLLAQADKLKLTADQKKSLEAMAKEMRGKAAAMLTPEQKKALGPVSDKPASPKEMMNNLSQTMAEKMDPYMAPMARTMMMQMLGMEEVMRPRMMRRPGPEPGMMNVPPSPQERRPESKQQPQDQSQKEENRPE